MILAIDQGTSATKAIVLDPVRGVVAALEIPIRPAYLADGGVEQDPAELLESVLSAGRAALEQAGPVDAVALANQGETVLAWDPATGKALTPAIGWQDRRSESLCAELTAAHGDWVAQRTGLVLDPYFSAPKMAWLRRNVTPEGVVTTSDSWLLHQLTGEFVTDASTASRSLLGDLDTRAWDPALLDLFGLADESLPRIVASDEVIGTTAMFGSELPVAGLIVDQQAALFAEGCRAPGEAKCTFGTGAFLLANTGPRAPRSASGLTTSLAWRARGDSAYCLDGQVYTAASAVRWLQELGFIRDAGELDSAVGDDGDDAGGVLCVPALAGLAAPWWRPDATASFTGMTLATRPGHLILAVLQGIAAQVAALVDLVGADTGAPLSRLRVDGGLTRCRTLMQATADLTQLPLEVYPSPHATAIGAAAFARLALDPALALADAVPAWTPTVGYEPRWSADRAADFRERWHGAVRANLGSTS